jgi:putative ABC transport system substrate-binding protein
MTSVVDRRRFLLTALVAVTIAAPLGASAQKQPGNARIGLLGDVPSFLNEEFRQGLRELGYVEGQNIVLVQRDPEG